MALTQCPKCGQKGSRHAKWCSNCGYPIGAGKASESPESLAVKPAIVKTNRFKKILQAVGYIVALVVSIIVGYLAMQSVAMNTERSEDSIAAGASSASPSKREESSSVAASTVSSEPMPTSSTTFIPNSQSAPSSAPMESSTASPPVESSGISAPMESSAVSAPIESSAVSLPTPQSSSTAQAPATYQAVLDVYSEKLRAATPGLVAEYNREAAQHKGDVAALAELSTEIVGKLASISVEGTEKMAEILLYSGGSYDTYEEWAGKLSNVYMEEAGKITDAYMKSAM